jgi:AbrB family looped-hinge helix DNA binding protein
MANGIINGMTLRMDKSGRIVFPKPLRRRLGLRDNMELQVVEQGDGVLLRPAEPPPSMIQVNGLWVHQGAAEAGVNWSRVLDDEREERIQAVLKA